MVAKVILNNTNKKGFDLVLYLYLRLYEGFF